jgi:pilus assembly protein CpaB
VFSSVPHAVRARRALARPAVRRCAALLLAVATVLAAAGAAGAVGRARDRWGSTRRVLVASRDLAPGEALDAAAVAHRDLPAALVPGASLSSRPEGVVVRQPILAGEPVVRARLAPPGLTGPAALVESGRRAVAVPRGPAGMPPLAVGDLVDVLTVVPIGTGADAGGGGPGDAESAGDDHDAPAFPLVERASVVDVTDAAVTLSVPQRDAARLAWSLANGTVVLALAGA